MKGRLRVSNPKELSQTAKVLGLTSMDFMIISLFLLVSPVFKINAFLKFLIPLMLISLNKYLNRKHPGNIYISLFRKRKVLHWAGVIKEIKK
ncbi:MAG: hypothetical protein WC682_05460 [Parcubacteria group bacterium]|jgi:hypothetical protein